MTSQEVVALPPTLSFQRTEDQDPVAEALGWVEAYPVVHGVPLRSPHVIKTDDVGRLVEAQQSAERVHLGVLLCSCGTHGGLALTLVFADDVPAEFADLGEVQRVAGGAALNLHLSLPWLDCELAFAHSSLN